MKAERVYGWVPEPDRGEVKYDDVMSTELV